MTQLWNLSRSFPIGQKNSNIANVANIKCPNALGHFTFATFKTSRSTKKCRGFYLWLSQIEGGCSVYIVNFWCKRCGEFYAKEGGRTNGAESFDGSRRWCNVTRILHTASLAKLGQHIQPTSSILLFFNLYCSVLLRGIQYIFKKNHIWHSALWLWCYPLKSEREKIVKSKWLDFAHFWTKWFFWVCTVVKQQISKILNKKHAWLYYILNKQIGWINPQIS